MSRVDVVLTERAGDDADQASRHAQAELDRRTAQALVLRARGEGQPFLRAGSVVEIEGAAQPFCGRHVATEVEHRLDAVEGFTTEFSTEPPPPPPERRGAVLTVGDVSRVDDPDELGRVRLSLPAYGDIESGWLPVACAGAGLDKGFVHLPDVGDRVAVLFAHEDAAEGLVLGGLFGDDLGVDDGVAGTERRRFTWQSPEGQRIQLDDDEGAMRLDAKRLRFAAESGTQLTIDEDETAIRSQADLFIEAPGRKIVIRAARIEFEQASAQEPPEDLS